MTGATRSGEIVESADEREAVADLGAEPLNVKGLARFSRRTSSGGSGTTKEPVPNMLPKLSGLPGAAAA